MKGEMVRLEEINMEYFLRRSRRAKQVRISVNLDGVVAVSLPFFYSEQLAEDFVRKNIGWILSKRQHFTEAGVVRYGARDYAKHKDAALQLVQEKIFNLNVHYGHAYNAIRIKNQKTCWGSCSRNGNLNFNFRILFLPEHVQDYIVVHELCHLKELNHSPQFWKLVAKVVPEYAKIRRGLRKNKIGFI